MMELNRVILVTPIILILIGFVWFDSSIESKSKYEQIDEINSKIYTGNTEIIVPTEKIEQISILDNIIPSESPDLVVTIDESEPPSILNEIKYSITEPEPMENKINEYEVRVKVIYNDNSYDIIENKKELQSLDFIAIRDELKEISNGKIELTLTVPIEKEIKISENIMTVYFDEFSCNQENPPTELNSSIDCNTKLNPTNSKNARIAQEYATKYPADVIDNKLIYKIDVDLNPILKNAPNGIHSLIINLEKLFILYDDGTKEYANPYNTIYKTEIEISDSESIIKNNGLPEKIYDSDVPITISTNKQSVQAIMCLSNYRGGGCASQYTTSSIIPAPALGYVKITNLETNEIVAEMNPTEAGRCNADYRYFPLGNQAFCAENSVTESRSLSYNAQRGQTYQINVSDPYSSWTIEIPMLGGEYHYSCVAEKGTKSGTTVGRNCNFPTNP